MNSRRWFFLIVGSVGALAIFLCLTIFLVPDREIQDLVVRLAEQEGFSLHATRFAKRFPLGIEASGLEISGKSGPLLKIGHVSARLMLLPLVTGRVTFGFRADIGNGRIDGDFSPRYGDIRIEASGLRLEDLSFFTTLTGASVKGDLRFSGSFRGTGKEPAGELRLDVKGAQLSGVKIGEMPLPDLDNAAIQGMFRKKGADIMLESFTLKGEGFFVRLKGDFPLVSPPGAAPLNLTLELMPKPEFLDKQKFVFLLLSKYLVSPGNYSIPIRGTLARPAIQ